MGFDLEGMLIALPGVLVGLVLHELAHAWTAHKLGDPTPRAEGRLSLNPLKHLDPIGFLFLLVAGFGWAKPVRINRGAFARPRRDESLVAVAGPLTNLVLGIVLGVVLVLLAPTLAAGGQVAYYALRILLAATSINFALCLFNMLPIPPLDGAHVLFSAIKIGPELEYKLYRWGTLALLAILVIERQADIDILPIGKMVNFMVMSIFRIFGYDL